MKPIFAVLITLLFTSCISDTQQHGLDEIALLYNAKTSYSKSFNKSNGKKTVKYFNINISDSKMLDSLNPVTTCPNIALMLYDNFDEKEKKAYTYINVKFKNKKDTISFNYEPDTLQKGLNQSSIFTEFSEKLLVKNYDGMLAQLEPKYHIKDLKMKLKNYFDILINKHGEIKKYKRTGFGSVNLKDGKKLFKFSGYLTFSDGYNRAYFINLSMQIDNDNIQGYNFAN